ncbi:MAG: ATP-binding cassette domain-containing protein [bacterium]|nr:ATP-binding cassette domain-containing protein [bacterium]
MNNEYAINIENATVLIDGKEILSDICWKVKRGEKCFILGANGAGKTTLVRTVLGYIWPLYGAKVEVLGELYGATNLNILRKKIAWVSPFIQQYLDRSLTGLDMVLSGPDGYLGFYRKATDEEMSAATEILENLNAEQLANKSILGMSSGQQMKILVARALLTKPELMILDEPNVYLDIAEREFILSKIDEIAKNNPNLTIIFISQRIEDILPIFDKGMIMNNGRIDVIGSRKEVLSAENLKRTFGINIKLVETDNGRLWALC